MATAPQLGVLIMDDGREFGQAACERIPKVRPASVRLARQGAPDRPGLRTVATVPGEKFTLRTALKAAAKEGLFLVAAPRNVQDPLSAFIDATRAAAGALDERHPGFAVAFADPGFEFNRIAAIADLRDPVTTGLSAWAAVGFAGRFGTQIDVLVLGAEPGDEPADWHEAVARFNIRADGEELVRDAIERAIEHGLRLNWKALGSPADKPAAVLRAVVEGGYDLVVDDIPPISVGPKPGRRRRVQAALAQAGSNATAYRLVRDAPCSVGVVLDAARMGLVPDDIVRAGAATVALGLVGAGAVGIAGQGGAAEAATTMTATGPTGAAEAVAQVAAADPVAQDVSAMSAADLAVMQQQLNDAVSARQEAASELGQQQKQQQAAEAGIVSAQKQQEALAPSASDARSQADEAARDSAYKQIATAGPLALIPVGPTPQEAADAKEKAQQLKRQADALEASVKAAEETEAALQERLEAVNEGIAATVEELATIDGQVTALNQQTADLAWQLNPVSLPVAPGYSITSTFREVGGYWSSGFHTGLDFAHSTGADVFAAKDGVVIEAGWGGAYGNTIVIQHQDGTQTRYAHLSRIVVGTGQQVAVGQHIGDVGATGNVTGPHLHFEVLDAAGNFLDPVAWLGIPV